MKTKLLLLAVAAIAFGSCTTMYKTGQTPDDVYYSPARNYGAAAVEKRSEPADDDEYYVVNNNDRMIRLGINDYRWRYLNNDWAYSPYSYYNNYGSYYNNYGSYYNGYGLYGNHGYYDNFYGSYSNPYYNSFYNNYYYNPYYSPYPVYITPVNTIKTSTPRVTNLNGYSHNYNNANSSRMPSGSIPPVRAYNNTNGRTSAVGQALNRVFAPSSTNNSNTNNSYNNTTNRTTTTERTYTPPPPSNNSSSSGSSSSGGGGGRVITRPN